MYIIFDKIILYIEKTLNYVSFLFDVFKNEKIIKENGKAIATVQCFYL